MNEAINTRTINGGILFFNEGNKLGGYVKFDDNTEVPVYGGWDSAFLKASSTDGKVRVVLERIAAPKDNGPRAKGTVVINDERIDVSGFLSKNTDVVTMGLAVREKPKTVNCPW